MPFTRLQPERVHRFAGLGRAVERKSSRRSARYGHGRRESTRCRSISPSPSALQATAMSSTVNTSAFSTVVATLISSIFDNAARTDHGARASSAPRTATPPTPAALSRGRMRPGGACCHAPSEPSDPAVGGTRSPMWRSSTARKVSTKLAHTAPLANPRHRLDVRK